MTHEELLAKVKDISTTKAVVELHKNDGTKYWLSYAQQGLELCAYCREEYPCKTIQAIEKELS